ncbi:MAG: hypothetical protein ABI577_16035 [bacterium]
MNKKLKLFVLGAAAIVPAAAVMMTSAASPNLIANGNFDSNVAGWDNFSGNPTLFKNSMQVTDDYKGEGNSYYSGWYCVKNVTPGTQYSTTGDAWVPESAPDHSGADLSTVYYASNDCSGSNLKTGGGSESGGRNPDQRGKWLHFSFKSTAPDGAHSVRVRATAFKEPKAPATSIQETNVVYFDNMYFGEAEKLIAIPDPTKAPKGPGDIVAADPQPTQTPKGPGDIVANNPQPTSTPQAPDTGDTAPVDDAKPGDDANTNTNTTDGIDVLPQGSDTKNADSNNDTNTKASDGYLAPAAQDEGGSVGLGLGLMFIAFGGLFAAIGLGFGALAKRRRNQD